MSKEINLEHCVELVAANAEHHLDGWELRAVIDHSQKRWNICDAMHDAMGRNYWLNIHDRADTQLRKVLAGIA